MLPQLVSSDPLLVIPEAPNVTVPPWLVSSIVSAQAAIGNSSANSPSITAKRFIMISSTEFR